MNSAEQSIDQTENEQRDAKYPVIPRGIFNTVRLSWEQIEKNEHQAHVGNSTRRFHGIKEMPDNCIICGKGCNGYAKNAWYINMGDDDGLQPIGSECAKNPLLKGFRFQINKG